MSRGRVLVALLAVVSVALRLGAQAPETSGMVPVSFDARRLDVAGLRVGGSAKNFATTLKRLFGKAVRVRRRNEWFLGYAAALEVNATGCLAEHGRGSGAAPGSICVTAFLDSDDIVRGIRIERVFPYFDGATFREAMVRRYGPAMPSTESARYALGWGPTVPPALAYDSSAPTVALTALYSTDNDLRTFDAKAAPNVRITLQLIDAAWASAVR